MTAPRSLRTASRLLTTQGPAAVARAAVEKAGIWWRHGGTFDVGRLTGHPAPIARLDGCAFELRWPAVTEDMAYILLSGQYEKPERSLIKRYVPADVPVVELGGAFGVVACLTNRRLADPAQHVVVEANPAVIPVLRVNRQRNHCAFTIRHAALAYDTETIGLCVDANPLKTRVDGALRTVAVPTVTLKQLVDAHGFERCTLICDIEGAELDLVRHEAEVIRDRVETIILELHARMLGSEHADEVLMRLRGMGFQVVGRYEGSVVLRTGRA